MRPRVVCRRFLELIHSGSAHEREASRVLLAQVCRLTQAQERELCDVQIRGASLRTDIGRTTGSEAFEGDMRESIMLLNTPQNSARSNFSSAQQQSIGRKVAVQPSSFPGATAPGTGSRHFPEVQVERSAPAGPKERSEKFEMRTTKEYYKDFPGLVRSSTPLYIKTAGPQEPLGKLELQLEDAGPQTGHRRMPGTVDSEGRTRPRLPSHPEDPEDLQRERDSRYKLF